MFCPALSSVIFQVGSPLLRVGQERAQIDLFSVGPEVLKRIELARLIIEHVDNLTEIVPTDMPYWLEVFGRGETIVIPILKM